MRRKEKRGMNKIRISFVVMIICFTMLISSTLAASLPPSKGDVLPKINLPIPKSSDEKSYLGL
jgi:hypothetical protein